MNLLNHLSRISILTLMEGRDDFLSFYLFYGAGNGRRRKILQKSSSSRKAWKVSYNDYM